MIADVLDCYSGLAHDGEPRHGEYKKIQKRLPDVGVEYFVLYQLDRAGYTEHGGGVPGWLTPRGIAFREAIGRYGVDTVTNGQLDYRTGDLFDVVPYPTEESKP